MFVLRLFEVVIPIVLVLGIAVMFATQIVWPIMQGRKLFPMFRKQQNELRETLMELDEQAAEIELAAEVERRVKAIEERRRQVEIETK